ncbi:MAG: type IV pilus assembly protein PilM [Deltaproteobacteria bacterium]|nr:type IV pilus assembly protein PilM [Deltaproteobacteria bacterium]
MDIGTQSIKIIALEKRKHRWRLSKFRYEQFSSRGEEDPIGYDKWLQETLKSSISAMGLEGSWASTPLSGTQVALRKMTFPDMPLDEVKAAVRFQGQTIFPFVLENAVIDVALVGKLADKKEAKQDVLVAAAMRDQVNQRINLLNGANLNPFCLSLVPIALTKTYLLNKDRAPNESVALIDIGAHTSTIAMVQKEEVVFSREIGIGGESLTEALMDLSRIDHPGGILNYQEAEKIKFEYGIPLDEIDEEQTEGGLTLEAIREALMPIVDRLIMEIDRSFGYFKTQAENQSIDRIFLSGGGSLLQGLRPAIGRSFNLPVADYDFWDKLEMDPEVDPAGFMGLYPLFIAPLGLAMDDDPAINLLPFKRKSSGQVFWETGKKALIYGLGPLAFLGFLGYQALGLRSDLDQLNRRIAKRQVELTRLQGTGTEMGRLRQEEAALDQKLSVYPPRMVARLPVQEILGKISRNIPSNMTLTALSLTAEPIKEDPEPGPRAKNPAEGPNSAGGPVALNGETTPWKGGIQLKGTVFGAGEEVLRSLDQFSQALAAQQGFKEIRLEDVKRSETFKSPAVDFTLSGKLQF